MAKPQVIVNPLSLVTPGIFREIFQMTPEDPRVQPRDRPSPKAMGPRCLERAGGRRVGRRVRRARSVARRVGGSWSAEHQRIRSQRMQVGAASPALAAHALRPIGARGAASSARLALRPACRSGILVRSRPRHSHGTGEGPDGKAQARQVGIEIAPLMFGGNVFGWTADEATSFKLLDAFVDAGFNFIDTADVYSQLGAGPQGRRVRDHHRQVAEGARRARQGRHRHQGRHGDAGRRPRASRRPTSCSAVEDSLKRLQTDYIDLYQSHIDDKATPLEETLGAYAELIEQGKVRVIGASNYEAPAAGRGPEGQRRQEAAALREPAAALQSLRPRRLREGAGAAVPEGEGRRHPLLRAGARLPDRQVPLGSRLRQEPARRRHEEVPQRARPAHPEGARRRRARLGATPAQVALAWLIARPSITAPIASATSLEQLEDLIAGVRLKLDRDAIKALDAASAY